MKPENKNHIQKSYLSWAILLVLILVLIVSLNSHKALKQEISSLQMQISMSYDRLNQNLYNQVSEHLNQIDDASKKEASLFTYHTGKIHYDGYKDGHIPLELKAVPKKFDPAFKATFTDVNDNFGPIEAAYTDGAYTTTVLVPAKSITVMPIVTLKSETETLNEALAETYLDFRTDIGFHHTNNFNVSKSLNDNLFFSGNLTLSFSPTYYHDQDGKARAINYPLYSGVKYYKNDELFREDEIEFYINPNEVSYHQTHYYYFDGTNIKALKGDRIKVVLEFEEFLGIKHTEILYEHTF